MKIKRVASSSRLRILVLGYIVRGPLGGMVWHHLQYLMGLVALGHDVCFLEDSDDYPSCYDPETGAVDWDPSYGVAFLRRTFEMVGLDIDWAYYDALGNRWIGPCADRVTTKCAEADLLLNLSGINPMRPWLAEVPRRALVDTDPVFTQVAHLTEPSRAAQARAHNVFFSFGENIASGRSQVPDDGLPWQPTRQPVVLEAWPVTEGQAKAAFTTVMQWKSYPAVEYAGRRYGVKSESFQSYLDLPTRTGAKLELAIGSPSAPRQQLQACGWRLRDPLEVTRSADTYRSYLRGSKGEFTIAKHGYVVSRCGWFSERSAAYLASGRPVITEDTGFGDHYSAPGGLLPFSTPEQAHAALEQVGSRYDWHCRQARAVAAEYFDYRKVLPSMLETAVNG